MTGRRGYVRLRGGSGSGSGVGRVSKSGLRVTCMDGRQYDFGTFRRCRAFPNLLAIAFSRMLSKNKNEESRRATNGAIFCGLRRFLKWVEGGGAGTRRVLSYWVLSDYRNHLLKKSKLTGAHASCQLIWAACRILQAKDVIETFPLPSPINYWKALAQGSGSRTLADLSGRSLGPSAVAKRNEELMSLLLAYCHEKARECESRLSMGEKWRRDLQEGHFTPPMGWSPDLRTVSGLTREAMVETACKVALLIWDGVIPEGGKSRLSGGNRPAMLFAWLVFGGGRMYLLRGGQKALRVAELRNYLFPPSEYFAVVTVILAAANVNPLSVRNLHVGSLVRAPSRNADTAYIVFPKPRANGDVRAGPFLVGGADDDTVPRLLERCVAATNRLRSRASKELSQMIFIGIRFKGSSARPLRPCRVACPAHLINWHLKPMLRSEVRPKYRQLRAVANSLSAKLIRATAKSITHRRSGGDVRLTALVGGNMDERVLNSSYLVNPQAKAFYEETMALGQEALEKWLRAPIEIVADTDAAVSRALRVDAELARSIRRGERSLSSGLCMFYERAIVIDTPLNCLRMIQYRRSIQEAEERMMRENPERWSSVLLPQLRWFDDAIADFPRKTRGTARKLDETYAIPMPEIA